jgi:putative ABC transport system permease protein
VDPTQVAGTIQSFDDVLARSMAPWRFVTWLMTAFAFVAVGLASVGLAAVMASTVTRRTREIGVRVSLGATPRSIVRLMLAQSAVTALAGAAAGVALAYLTTGWIADSLYGVTPRDPATFAGAATLIVVVAILAGYLPARRAGRVDPLVALRYD